MLVLPTVDVAFSGARRHRCPDDEAIEVPGPSEYCEEEMVGVGVEESVDEEEEAVQLPFNQKSAHVVRT